MAEYIEREKVIKAAKTNKAVCRCEADIVDVQNIVNCVPTANVCPERHGRWSDKMVVEQMNCAGAHADDIRLGYRCSECGQLSNKTKYCGNCGAKMDGEDSDNNG